MTDQLTALREQLAAKGEGKRENDELRRCLRESVEILAMVPADLPVSPEVNRQIRENNILLVCGTPPSPSRPTGEEVEWSQVQAFGGPAPKTWDDYEAGCHATFGGGYQTEKEREIFRHGMTTVFNMLRREFKPAAEARRIVEGESK